MSKRVTAEVALARFHMFSEAADHLGQSVSDNAAEREAACFAAREIRRRSETWNRVYRFELDHEKAISAARPVKQEVNG